MFTSQKIAAGIAGLMSLAALVLLVERGGLIAWLALFVGLGLLVKTWLMPSRRDLGLSIGGAALLVLAWIGTYYYVIATYESGEVVELAVDTNEGLHLARLWVMDIGDEPTVYPTVYYDAPPEVAASLLAGNPLRFTRAGEVSTRIPKATRVDAMPEDEGMLILEAMQAKYGERYRATATYYVLLGVYRERVPLVASLIPR